MTSEEWTVKGKDRDWLTAEVKRLKSPDLSNLTEYEIWKTNDMIRQCELRLYRFSTGNIKERFYQNKGAKNVAN